MRTQRINRPLHQGLGGIERRAGIIEQTTTCTEGFPVHLRGHQLRSVVCGYVKAHMTMALHHEQFSVRVMPRHRASVRATRRAFDDHIELLRGTKVGHRLHLHRQREPRVRTDHHVGEDAALMNPHRGVIAVHRKARERQLGLREARRRHHDVIEHVDESNTGLGVQARTEGRRLR